MIFVTIGTQEPFDRLIKIMDEFASEISEEVIAQVFNNSYRVRHMKTLGFLDPLEYNTLFTEARLIVSHAGMGTIISALTKNKPIIVLPRIAKLGEHRNEHQLDTIYKLKELGYIRIANNEIELKTMLYDIIKQPDIKPLHQIEKYASEELITSLHQFISI